MPIHKWACYSSLFTKCPENVLDLTTDPEQEKDPQQVKASVQDSLILICLSRSSGVPYDCEAKGDLRQMSEYPILHREHCDSCILRRRCKSALLHSEEEIQVLIDLP
jgi:hypothetical protein